MPSLRPQNYVVDGYVRAGYCAPWAAPGGLKHVNHAAMSFDLARLPLYPEYTIEFNQWSRESGGGVLFAGDPACVRLFHTLSWSSIKTADRDNLELFFRTVARAQSEQWTWWNPVHGNSLLVRFADSNFPETPEVALGHHRLSGLRLMLDSNLPGQVPTGSHSYSASMGTALAIGSVIMQFPPPQRPSSGSGLSTRYCREDSSAGLPVVYRVGATCRRRWTLSWDNLRYLHWIRLQAFFCSFVRGMATPFAWYDTDGSAHTVRLGAATISVKQLAYDRFSCDLSLTEDL